jgi:hypothetical protein
VESSNDVVLIYLSICIFESQGRLATATDAIELENSNLVPGLQLVYIGLAHFAAKGRLLGCFRRESHEAGTIARTMTTTLFDSYYQAEGAIYFQKVIVYVAGHIGRSLHYTDHGTNDESLKAAACMQTVAMIEDAGAKRWGRAV